MPTTLLEPVHIPLARRPDPAMIHRIDTVLAAADAREAAAYLATLGTDEHLPAPAPAGTPRMLGGKPLEDCRVCHTGHLTSTFGGLHSHDTPDGDLCLGSGQPPTGKAFTGPLRPPRTPHCAEGHPFARYGAFNGENWRCLLCTRARKRTRARRASARKAR